MQVDWLIRGGEIVDGSASPRRRGDVAIRDGRIVGLGEVSVHARREIDAGGCWVTPGFIDPHTHLDAQLCWDATASPSNLHGVTTVVLGLCGFGVAPCPAGGGDYLLRCLERVEEIPHACTRAGVPFAWSSWTEYRDYLAARPLAVNAAGFVPHSALRYYVMGDRARGELATAEDRAAMVRELESAFAAGAVGFATSRGPNHVDGYQEPVPSRYADALELQALVSACRGRVWQINVESKFSHDSAVLTEEVERYAAWSRAAGARLTWSPFHAEPGETVWREVLEHNRRLNGSGVRVAPQVTAEPITLLLRFDEPCFLTSVIGWEEALAGFFELEPAARMARLGESAVRAAMKRGGGDPRQPLNPDFEVWRFARTPSRPKLAGVSVAEVAGRDGQHPVDLFCDQVVADELATLIEVPVVNRSRQGAVGLVEDENTLLALGDSGAHVMSITNYRYPSFVLGELVRDRGALPLELAVNRLSRVPALLYGLGERGLLREGGVADLCVLEPSGLGVGPVSVRHDLPGDSPRLYQAGRGYRCVMVAGELVVEEDRPTGSTPGRMLRAEPLA